MRNFEIKSAEHEYRNKTPTKDKLKTLNLMGTLDFNS